MARRPRKATPRSLENAALHYLERFASSSENLRRVLMRRVRKSAEEHGVDPEEGAADVDAIVERLARSGVLDDRTYAQGRVATLRRRGDSARAIRGKLTAKGVRADLVAEALDGTADLAVAVTLARRRRLGPWRSDAREEKRERDMAALARAGFSYDVARKVIDATSAEELEDMAETADGGGGFG